MKVKRATKKLVIVADDFGLAKEINEGILRACREGFVTEFSLMLKSPSTQHAVDIIKKCKLRDVGIHLLLVGFDDIKRMFRRSDYVELFKNKNYQEIQKLAELELRLFEKLIGKKPTHIIPQYGIHGNLKLLDFLLGYAKKYDIPMRLPRTTLGEKFGENYAAEIMLRRSGVRTTKYLFGHVLGSNLLRIEREFIDELARVKGGESAEVLTHPGYFDEEVLKLTSLNYERARDLAMCLDKKFEEKILNLGYHLVSFSQI
ncbi:MAG: hypothetical protein ACD_57C00094G0001 [uncultured bacterium]|uniref:ChbG/HpnK family deacetylase n=1 Tax=Candidatus Woesebacteria bacterium RIFCSPLOWO2_01_FULL_39_21 TaxID=1802519 RepID=A0A1F8BHC3_9BACT|nr:MAG: hypothetical protein ACD_57C00094G0001 [uncultured bacterium]OGM22757.1 MAG: hypothetical protein A2691_02680 [Candidatus Woesebacteria bacterium RIFCSPHIGHO2_01_FULL_39_23]OGM63451.1 MAG: hypothetical protein A2961_03230 [Candidatus Woesebacteria bacterium RIFCSPLOWO2_01_FULL_39_21]